MSAWRTWPAVVAASAVLAVVVVLLGAWEPARAGVVAWFALAIPGGALIPLLGLRDVVAEVTLAIALSLAIDVVVACTMLYSGVWSPPAGVVVLAIVALAGTALQARRNRPSRELAGLPRLPPATADPGAHLRLAVRNGRAAQLNLNAATAEQLSAVRGVGPATAQRIVAWRAAHGSFRSVEDLVRVPGVGPKRIAALRGRVQP
jgi:competence ComEA-like helix-hairpin-helix protein